MRYVAVAIAFLALLSAKPSGAEGQKANLSQCWPDVGLYFTGDGTMLPGRMSQGWCTGTGFGSPGNAINMSSFNPYLNAIGTDWMFWGMTIDGAGAIETARDMDGCGTGWIDYATNYSGGTFWLSGWGPFGNGECIEGYTGTISLYSTTSRVHYVEYQIVGISSNIHACGNFDVSLNVWLNLRATAQLDWRTGMPWVPTPYYPIFECESYYGGELYSINCAKIEIMEIWPWHAVETASWGSIKALFGNR